MFAGGFELASIHAVATCGDAVDVLRHLDSLVRKSLVVADHSTTRTRYSLFETIRQFAEDRLEAAGELAATRDIAAHAALMGFSVQLFETLAWAEELLPAACAADVSRLPRLYTAGYACFAGRAEAARWRCRWLVASAMTSPS